MASQGKSIQQRAERQRKPGGRNDRKGAQDQFPAESKHCGVCFLTFGSQEKRASWRGKAIHLGCLERLRQAAAA